MKALKIWFLGTLCFQGLLWAYMLALSAVEPAAGWLIFPIIYLLTLSLFHLPVLAVVYQIFVDRVNPWKWWHSFLLWISTFVLVLIVAILFMIARFQG